MSLRLSLSVAVTWRGHKGGARAWYFSHSIGKVIVVMWKPPHSCSRPSTSTFINSVRIDLANQEAFFERVSDFLACGRSHVIHLLAADPTVLARRMAGYREVLNRGDLNIADGAPVAVAARLFGLATVRQTGRQTMRLLFSWETDRKLKHFFVGSTEAVLGRLHTTIRDVFPQAQVAGSTSPPFRELTPREIDSLAAAVREVDTDILWIGLGTPAQHYLGRALADRDAAPAIVCVGAAFEFLAGFRKEAPRWMQRMGLEWLHRLLSEPRRLWKRYLIGNPLFVAGVLVDALFPSRRRAR